MPSWNIHTAHVEHLLARHRPDELGIADADAFLLGNYLPDIYVGYMVPDTTFHLDYCVTHFARPHVIPAPDADRFWDEYVSHPLRKPTSPSGASLALGVWAHLLADRVYNLQFREFCEGRGTSYDDELRRRKQADFKRFGDSLDVRLRVNITPALLETARSFRQYSVLPADVERAVAVADAIVGEDPTVSDVGDYQLLSAPWMDETFDACDRFLSSWLTTWMRLGGDGAHVSAADVHAALAR